jgi:DNA-3-methyladenine glycosylase II
VSRKIITHLSQVDPVMRALIAAAGAYRIRREPGGHPYEALARAITHQQLNGKAAAAIFGRLIALGTGAFPTPQEIVAFAPERMRSAGLSLAKITSLKDLAAKTLEGIVPTREVLIELPNEAIVERLTQVRGIGRWSVEMILMFQLDRADVLPVDDFGVRNGFRLAYGLRAMPHPRALALYGERWGPYRTAAAWYLWRAVELAQAGRLPAPVERIRLPRVPRRRRAARKAAHRRSRGTRRKRQ